MLEEKGIHPVVVDYLKTPPTLPELQEIRRALDIPAKEMLRRKEAEFNTAGLDRANLEDDALVLSAIATHPKLLERPVVVHNGDAVIARPPEKLLALLG